MLQIYRRHLSPCKYKSRRFRNCRCAIWVQGTLGGERVRRSLDLRAWEAATDLVNQWSSAGKIGGVRVKAPSVSEAVSRFLADAESRVSASSMKKYRRLLEGELLPYCELKKIVNLERLTVDFLRTFKASVLESHAKITQQKKVEYLRAFMSFCLDADWVSKNSAKAVKITNVKHQPTLPFEQEEIQRLLDACEKFKGNGARLHAIINLLRFSGLRIGDAVALERKDVKDGRVFLYTAKTGTPVRCPLPAHVVKELESLPGEKFFFWNGTSKLKTALEHWRRAFVSLAETAKVENAHFHRFRDSAAIAWLSGDKNGQNALSIEQVAMLLGNTPAIVLRHYRPWVVRLQSNLERAVELTLA